MKCTSNPYRVRGAGHTFEFPITTIMKECCEQSLYTRILVHLVLSRRQATLWFWDEGLSIYLNITGDVT